MKKSRADRLYLETHALTVRHMPETEKMGAHAHRRKHTTRTRIACRTAAGPHRADRFRSSPCFTSSMPAQSGEVAAARAFDIPAQSLASALEHVRQAIRIAVTLASSTSDGVTSRAVKARSRHNRP